MHICVYCKKAEWTMWAIRRTLGSECPGSLAAAKDTAADLRMPAVAAQSTRSTTHLARPSLMRRNGMSSTGPTDAAGRDRCGTEQKRYQSQ